MCFGIVGSGEIDVGDIFEFILWVVFEKCIGLVSGVIDDLVWYDDVCWFYVLMDIFYCIYVNYCVYFGVV